MENNGEGLFLLRFTHQMCMISGCNFSFDKLGKGPVLKKSNNIIVRAPVGINCVITENASAFKKIRVLSFNITDTAIKFIYTHPIKFAAKLRQSIWIFYLLSFTLIYKVLLIIINQ